MEEKALTGEPLVVLLVEDNPDHAELIMRNMEDFRVANQIIHVADGEAALDYLFRRGRFAEPQDAPRPNLVLLDLRLPRIDGLEVLRTVKAAPRLRHIPVVVLTTSKAEQDVARAYEHHANSYITKPVDFYEFTEMMQDLGFYWLAWNTRPTPG